MNTSPEPCCTPNEPCCTETPTLISIRDFDRDDSDSIKASVRQKYAAIARGEESGCCSPVESTDESAACCSPAAHELANYDMIGDAYDGVDGYVADADLKLGCGVPVEHAGMEVGQTVLDLGSGAGLDAFVARRIVGETGRVLGVDFTPEMVRKARENTRKMGFDNVEFEHGDIENLPFEDASVDVVISNCVLNLVPDKRAAFRQMARVIRPGGHFCVSDIVSGADMPAWIRKSAALYAGCIAGVIDRADYLTMLQEAGFTDVVVVSERMIELPETLADGLSQARKDEFAAVRLSSVTVRGQRV